MTKNLSINPSRSFFWIILSFVLSFPWAAQATIPETSPCFQLTEIQPGDRFRGDVGYREPVRCFELAIPSAGEVTVDVNSGNRAAFLQVLEENRSVGKPWPRLTIQEKGISSLRLSALEATHVRLGISPQDTRLPIEGFTLITGFSPAEGLGMEADLLPADVTKDLEQGEREDPGEIEIEPWGGPDTKGGRDLATRRLAPPCLVTQLDDHGDTPPCATRVSGYPAAADGVIANAMGDDEDVFTFEVKAPQRFEVHIDSEADLSLQLEDGQGRRLATGNGTWGSQNRLAAALLPGRHFVRVVGNQGAEGDYVLRLDTPDGTQ